LLKELADVQANVLDVVHSRTSAQLHLGEVDVDLQVETRGEPHAQQVLAHLRSCGYLVTEAPAFA
jgi:threonine dehydratase